MFEGLCSGKMDRGDVIRGQRRLDQLYSINPTDSGSSDLPKDPSRRDFLNYLKYLAVVGAVGGVAGLAYFWYRSQSNPPPGTTTTSTKPPEPTTETTIKNTTTEPIISKKGYPLLGNYYHIPDSISSDDAKKLAKWNMVVLNSQAAYLTPEEIRHIKNINPDIKILTWVSLGLWPVTDGGYFQEKVNVSSSEDWWIHKNGSGSLASRRLSPIPSYPFLVTPNPKSKFSDYFLRYIHEDLMSTELFDGIFYDCCWDDSWFSTVLKDTDISINEYREGITDILKNMREREDSNTIAMGNPGVEWRSESQYWNYANGHYQENVLGNQFGSGWPKILEIYERNMKKPSPPTRVHWIGVDVRYNRTYEEARFMSQDNLSPDDLRRMRFGLGITLLDDGYFGFDKGDGLHGQLWWFPEYNANLGFPKGKYERVADGTYRRSYDNGIVIVNPDSKKTIELSGKYQDMTTNEITERVIIPSNDARILIEI